MEDFFQTIRLKVSSMDYRLATVDFPVVLINETIYLFCGIIIMMDYFIASFGFIVA